MLERIAHGVANNSSSVQRRTLLFHFRFDDFLCVVPGSSRMRHKTRLVKAEDRDRNQTAHKKEGVDERERKCREEYRNENIQHAFLRVLRANPDYFLAVL